MLGWLFGGVVKKPIDQVLETYGQLQHNAAMMAALVRKSPELRRRAIEDWMKYGLLCEFWRSTIADYDQKEQLKLQGSYSQQMLKAN